MRRRATTNPWSMFWWTVAVVLTLVVAVLSLGPQPGIDAAEGISDKALHTGFYAALTGAYLAAGVLAAALCTLAARQLRSRRPEITAPRRHHGTP